MPLLPPFQLLTLLIFPNSAYFFYCGIAQVYAPPVKNCRSFYLNQIVECSILPVIRNSEIKYLGDHHSAFLQENWNGDWNTYKKKTLRERGVWRLR